MHSGNRHLLLPGERICGSEKRLDCCNDSIISKNIFHFICTTGCCNSALLPLSVIYWGRSKSFHPHALKSSNEVLTVSYPEQRYWKSAYKTPSLLVCQGTAQLYDPETKPIEDCYKAFLVKSFSHGTNLLESWVIIRQPPVQAKGNRIKHKTNDNQ